MLLSPRNRSWLSACILALLCAALIPAGLHALDAEPAVKKFSPKKQQTAKAKKRKKKTKRKALPPPSALKKPPEPEAPAPAPPAREEKSPVLESSNLAPTAGLLLEAKRDLRISGTLSDSAADGLGLKPGDSLFAVNGHKLSTPSELEWALKDLAPRVRLSAVAVRGLGVEALGSPFEEAEKTPERSASSLSPYEKGIQQRLLGESDARASQMLQGLRSPLFQVAEGERVWIRFIEGIPKSVEEGDILEGETSTVLTTDSNLDFVAIPEGSPVWAQVVSATDQDDARIVRLHIFKIRLRDGHFYPCSAIVDSISGRQDLARVTTGGTIVAAQPYDNPFVIEPGRDLRIRFLESWAMHENPDFFQAGAGFWFKSVPSAKGKREKTLFEITHIIPGRSAASAGLKVGDRLKSIASAHADNSTFGEAVQRTYGKIGSSFVVEVLREGGKPQEVRLKRGVVYRRSLGLRYRWEGDSAVVAKVFEGSPADRAGIKEGDHLLKIGSRELREINDAQLRKLFSGDLTDENALTFAPPGKSPRKASLNQEPVAFPLSIDVTPPEL